jgi:outer membrane protein TolC
MRAMTVAVLCAAGLGGVAMAQEPRRVTLAEALDLAVRAQPAMVQARQDVRVAQAQERQAFGAFLPTISSSASSNKAGTTRINATTGQVQDVPSYWNSQVGFSASYNIFTGFQRGAVRRQTRSTSEQRDATLLRQEYAVALQTKQVFFQALRGAALVSVQQTRLRSAEEQLRLTAERLRLGATTRSDSLRARVEYGNAQLALIQAQNDFRDAQANLGRAIQVEGPVLPVYDSTLEARVADPDTAVLRREAQAAAPSIREAEAALAAARAAHSASRSAYLPTLAISGAYNWAAADNLSTQPFRGRYLDTWNFRLTASYPIFNGFQRETSVITADAGVEAAEARLRDARLALDASLTQALAALEAAAARIDIARVSVQAAEEDLRLQRERYRLGAVTIIEVLASQGNLDQAQVDLVQARYDYLVARAQVEALVGHGL